MRKTSAAVAFRCFQMVGPKTLIKTSPQKEDVQAFNLRNLHGISHLFGAENDSLNNLRTVCFSRYRESHRSAFRSVADAATKTKMARPKRETCRDFAPVYETSLFSKHVSFPVRVLSICNLPCTMKIYEDYEVMLD